jgi:hypothetical protein
MTTPTSLQALATALESLPDPRSKQGVTHPYHGMLALVLIGLVAQMPYVAEIRRWAKKHWHTLREPLKFKRTKPPVETTIFRALAKTTVADFQKVFAEFLKTILAEDHDALTAAVDGKVAKNMKDANGDPLLLLNILVHELKIALIDYSVHGDKTNEPGCLKAHLESLFEQYPFLKLLTGDAIFAQRPVLEVLQEYGCDYLFQIKENQPDIMDTAKVCFAEANQDKPDDQVVEKRGQTSKHETSGATRRMRTMCVNG